MTGFAIRDFNDRYVILRKYSLKHPIRLCDVCKSSQVTTKVVIAVMASSTSAHAIRLHLLSY